MASKEIVAVFVTLRTSDHRNASASTAGGGMVGVWLSRNRSIGAWRVSAWMRALATCSAQAVKMSLSSSKSPMPRSTISAMNDCRM